MKSLKKSRVLIIGLGQVGGSLGMELVKKKMAAEIIGFDSDKTLALKAKKLRVIDLWADSLGQGVEMSDLIILATPIREILRLLPFVSKSARKDAVILDVGSTKAGILRKASQLGPGLDFIGGHPLTGTEKSGLESAETGRFVDTVFVLIPSKRTKQQSLELIIRLVRSLGAKPLTMTAEEHDRLIALTSHLPYLFALALMNRSLKYGKRNKKLWHLVAGSFRSATRVALSSPELTLDMFLTNRRNLAKLIDEMRSELSFWKRLVGSGNESKLRKLILRAKKRREQIKNA